MKWNSLKFSKKTLTILDRHIWPGNARELANAVERAAIISNTEIILPENLPPLMLKPQIQQSMTATGAFAIKTVQEAEKEAIQSALNEVSGNRTKAAKFLGISRRALIYKIKRFELD